jgi:hypothetical protein
MVWSASGGSKPMRFSSARAGTQASSIRAMRKSFMAVNPLS